MTTRGEITGQVADSATLSGLTGLGLGPLPLEAMVAAQLRCPRVRLLTVRLHAHPYDRPAVTTAGRHVVCGTAGGRRRPEQGLRLLRQARPGVDELTAVRRSARTAARAARAAMPWRTEPDVYRSDLRQRLPRGLSLPCAYRITDLDRESAVIWLDRVPMRRVRWDVARHRHAAYLLGRLAANPSVAALAAQPLTPPPRVVHRGQ